MTSISHHRPGNSDPSFGYDGVADAYCAARSSIGREVVETWAAQLPEGGAVLDVGAGSGDPMTPVLLEAGLDVFAIDASPRLVALYRERFPEARIACEPAETSPFFARTFDGVLAIGLVFLLPEARQRVVLAKMARALNSGGSLLFSAPQQMVSWDDALTGRPSRSLGETGYREILHDEGLDVVATSSDEGSNHYYHAVRPAS
ncbi:bifunctional 2-polyprenyl-6-hydroxyphenol methylase/3-demethylubiquinol 3-O-methyltransferase UbiG [Erythrobacter sp.]|uniref:class I SAM-dependent methyltransferase n=1 Tax=Erythrobacter sp. TaxID=1042 RepID=UPI0025BB52B4|nr:class I SAM-dependent methyltransferase [Erythrobacter sp.]